MRARFTVHDRSRLEAVFRCRRLGRELLRAFRTSFYKKHRTSAETLALVRDRAARGELSERVEFHALRLEASQHSRRDGASKLVFRSRAGLLVEAVILRIASGRTSLCLSSQTGCQAGCTFCATSRLRAVNLSAAEILDQIVQAAELLRAEGRRVRNIVFMGMGEPFHNEEALYESLDVLTSSECFHHSARKILVSTVGIPAAMVRCAHRFPGLNLALSLHSVREDVRAELMPLSRRYGLRVLRSALVELNRLQTHPVMIEYLLLKGLNDAPEDAVGLADYLRGLRVHVNLIPYNPIAAAPELESSDPPVRRSFAAALKAAGFSVTLRTSLGRDIAAACGQLAGVSEKA